MGNLQKYQFKFEPSVNCGIISVWDFPTRDRKWNDIKPKKSLVTRKNKVIPTNRVKHELENLFEKIENPDSADKILTAQKWIPENNIDPFCVYIDITNLSKKELKFLRKNKLTQGFYDKFAVINRGERPWNYYTQSMDFFWRFNQLVISKEDQMSIPYLLYQIPSNEAANKTYLFFSNTDGSGMLIKNMTDLEYASAGGFIDREIEVITIGSFLRCDVPDNAVILQGDLKDPLIDQFGEGTHVFLESLTPNSKPLHKGTELDFKRISTENPENLGRMLVFDMVTGAWDRHSGNYLIHDFENGSRSLQEIDFGLFDPAYWKAANWAGRHDEFLPSRYASIRGSKPGWDIHRHPKVSYLIKQADKERIQIGIQDAYYQVDFGIRTGWFEQNLSAIFCNRIQSFVDQNSPLRFSFQMDLASLDLFDPGI